MPQCRDLGTAVCIVRVAEAAEQRDATVRRNNGVTRDRIHNRGVLHPSLCDCIEQVETIVPPVYIPELIAPAADDHPATDSRRGVPDERRRGDATKHER